MNVIFDLDGTLVDSRPGLQYSLQKAVKEVFPNSQPDKLDFIIGPRARVILHQALPDVGEGELDKLETTFRKLYDMEGWKMSQPYPEVIKTLQELLARNHSLYIVTNKPALPTTQILTHLNLASYFKEVVCPDSHQPGYQDKVGSLRYLLDQYNLPAQDALFVGDTTEDYSAAEGCGLSFVGIQYGYGIFPGSIGPIQTVDGFHELLALIG